jgi:hypothetical protein
MEASGSTVKKKLQVSERKKVPVRKMPAEQKYTLALVVCLHKLPMLPQELLKEGLPSVSRELFKAKKIRKSFVLRTEFLTRSSGTGSAGFALSS